MFGKAFSLKGLRLSTWFSAKRPRFSTFHQSIRFPAKEGGFNTYTENQLAVHTLTPSFLATKLICPPGKKKEEFCDSTVRGLLIECRSAPGSVPTWYWRHKINGKAAYRHLGTIKDLDLDAARKQVTLLKAQQAMGQSAQAPADPARGMTLDAFWTAHYLPHAKVTKRSYGRDEQLYRLRIKDRFGDVPLKEIKRLQVHQFHQALLLEGLSKASANHHVQLLRRMLNLALEWDLLEKNPLTKFKLFPLDNTIENYLDEEQAKRLMNVLMSDENRQVALILMFLFATGARLREALCAEWKHIEGVHWRIPGSTAKSKRRDDKTLGDDAVWVLSQLDTCGKSCYLFPSPVTGKPYTTITRVWYRIRRDAQLPSNLRIHDLRHTFASRLVQAGRSLYEVQRALGHADPRTTMRYAHLSTKAMQQAVNSAAFIVPYVTSRQEKAVGATA